MTLNVDAQEAALGLLSMGHGHYHSDHFPPRPTPTAATSSATLNSILTTTASPMITSSTIPAKRKQNAIDASPDLSAYRLEFEQCPPTDTNNHNTPNINDTSDQSTEAVDCICGFPIDDGFSIACDICSRWCHGACFGIAQDGVPDDFECWVCKPRPPADKERAVRLQKERLGIGGSGLLPGGLSFQALCEDGREGKQRRKQSPGNDRKHRRASATTIDTGGAGKRKRRPSVVQPNHNNTIATNTPNNAGTGQLPTPNDDEHVDIDEPWMQSYVHITQDIIADDETRTKLRRHAQHWRGITAVTDVSSSTPPPITVKELPPHTTHNPFLTFNSNPQVLPPTYGVHTTAPIPSDRFITPYTSSIASSSSYLSNPLNAYAHLGMPKPFVHLFGPPLDLALDSRIVGNQGRFVRSGCRPNAVLRPVLCDKPAAEEETLGFGVFALRDLKAGEEIVLGWEWDDGNAVHNLPALLQTPHMFPSHHSSPSTTPTSPQEVQHIRNQMSNILHALSSTFTTCACGARAKDCALTQMAAFVEGQEHQLNAQRQRHEHEHEQQRDHIDLGPLVGRKRGFKTRERIPFSGGIGGMEMCVDRADEEGRRVNGNGNGHGRHFGNGKKLVVPVQSLKTTPTFAFAFPPSEPNSATKKGKERAVDGDVEMLGAETDSEEQRGRSTLPSNHLKKSQSPLRKVVIPGSPLPNSRIESTLDPRPPDPPSAGAEDVVGPIESEERMPPKMRKKWMHREVEAMKESSGSPGSGRSENGVGSPGGDGLELGFDGGGAGTKVGLGIRVESNGVVTPDGQVQDEEQTLMPPPPMPASLDPTTVSSVHASPLSPSPQLPTPSPTQFTSGMSLSPGIQIASMSPLTSFANLSLLSPAILSQSQHPTYPFPRSPKEPSTIWSPLRRTSKQSPPSKSSLSPSSSATPPAQTSPLPPPLDSTPETSAAAERAPASPAQPASAEDTGYIRVEEVPRLASTSPITPERRSPSDRPITPLRSEESKIDDNIPQPSVSWRSPSSSQDPSRKRSSEDSTASSRSGSRSPTGSTHNADMVEMEVDKHETDGRSPAPLTGAGTASLPNSSASEVPPPPSASATTTTESIQPTAAPEPEAPLAQLSAVLECIPGLEPAPESVLEPIPEPEPQPQEPARPASPPAQPKVKLSLRDFVLRKKKQREELELTKSVQASPLSVSSTLGGEQEGEADASGSGSGQDASGSEQVVSASTDVSASASGVDNSAEADVGRKDIGGDALGMKDGGSRGELAAVVDSLSDTMEGVEGSTIASVRDGSAETKTNGPPIRDSPSPGGIKGEDIEMAPPLAIAAPVPVVKPFNPNPTLNGYHQPPEQAPSPSPIPSKPLPLPIRMHSPPSAFPSYSTREAKQELVESPISGLSASRPAFVKSYPLPTPGLQPTHQRHHMALERSISPISPDLGLQSHSRRASHEDGEIGEASPPHPSSQRLNPPSPATFIPKPRSFSNFQPPSQSHSPPTGPRSFHAPSASPTPAFNGSSVGGSQYRPPPPTHIAPAATNATMSNNRPPPPSAPRALRQYMLSNRPAAAAAAPGVSSASSQSQSYSHGGSQYIPRGPSADRDRDRDRSLDWENRHYRAPRRGGGGQGWGR